MANRNTDRNLLFGILAIQMDFISRDALVSAMNGWVMDKSKPLGEILVEQRTLSRERYTLLEALVEEHLRMHGNDAERSLASLSSDGSVREQLEQIADPQLNASLVHVHTLTQREEDPYVTRTASVGMSTSLGSRFQILRAHAKGGLGQVSVAHDEELNREVSGNLDSCVPAIGGLAGIVEWWASFWD